MTERSVVRVDTGSGVFWMIGWLFTIGFAKLGLWKGLLGMLIWPYYLAITLRP